MIYLNENSGPRALATPGTARACPPRSPRSKKGKALPRTIAPPTVDDRLAAIDAGIRQLGFSVTDLAARLGEARGELAAAHGPAVRPRRTARPRRPRRPRHLHLVGTGPWTDRQAASLAAITGASR
jgi:hypothetical protein